MQKTEFINLAVSHAGGTANIRIYTDWSYSGVSRIPDTISGQFSGVINLLQFNISQGRLCKKDEYLLIYNFQPCQTINDIPYYSLDMVIKPISQITETNVNKGQPLNLTLNAKTGSIMNITMAMQEMGMTEEEGFEPEKEDAACYGNYKDHLNSTAECASNNSEPLFSKRLTEINQEFDFFDLPSIEKEPAVIIYSDSILNLNSKKRKSADMLSSNSEEIQRYGNFAKKCKVL